jgi:hypothetical protein
LNHVQGGTINPQGPIAADTNTRILLALSGHSGHRAALALNGSVAIDPKRTNVFEACSEQRLLTCEGLTLLPIIEGRSAS